MARHVLALDLGTSSVKALLVGEDGRVAGQGSAGYAIQRPSPGFAEQSPSDWWQATMTAVRQALAGAHRAEVAAIGLSGQMHGVVLLDEEDQVLHPAIIWPDRRSADQLASLEAQIGRQRLIELTGSPATSGFQASTIRWLLVERPSLWSKVKRIALPKDYLRWRLTGRWASDPSDASGTGLFDIGARTWSDEILAALNLDQAWLPPLLDSVEKGGRLARKVAEALDLPEGIPVATGAADTAAGLLGAGVVDTDQLLLTIGSGGQVARPSASPEPDSAGRLHTFCSALVPGEGAPGWYRLGATLSAGLSLRWLAESVLGLAGDDVFARLSAWAETAPPGSGGLVFLPYLSGARTPHMDPRARGMFLGLTGEHGRAELARAVMEGVAMSCLDAFEALGEGQMPVQRVIMAGGGARSSLWPQIVADVFGRPVVTLAQADQAGLGAAMLAAACLDLAEPVALARQWPRFRQEVIPSPDRSRLYQELFAVFRDAYRQNADAFRRLNALGRGAR